MPNINKILKGQIERFDEKLKECGFKFDGYNWSYLDIGFGCKPLKPIQDFLQSCQQEIIDKVKEEIEKDYIKHLLEYKCDEEHLINWSKAKEKAEVKDLQRWD